MRYRPARPRVDLSVEKLMPDDADLFDREVFLERVVVKPSRHTHHVSIERRGMKLPRSAGVPGTAGRRLGRSPVGPEPQAFAVAPTAPRPPSPSENSPSASSISSIESPAIYPVGKRASKLK